MANDETLAALERAARAMAEHDPDAYDAIRAHIETLRNGGERAQIVAWLRAGAHYKKGAGPATVAMFQSVCQHIASGAHLEGEG